MASSPTVAVRAWVNMRTDLMDGGGGGPLPNGAYLATQASPEAGAYAVLSTLPVEKASLFAEDHRVQATRVQAAIYAGTYEAGELAARAFALAVESMRGNPAPCGATGVMLLVTDNVTGPAGIPPAPDSGELYGFTVQADFILYQP